MPSFVGRAICLANAMSVSILERIVQLLTIKRTIEDLISSMIVEQPSQPTRSYSSPPAQKQIILCYIRYHDSRILESDFKSRALYNSHLAIDSNLNSLSKDESFFCSVNQIHVRAELLSSIVSKLQGRLV